MNDDVFRQFNEGVAHSLDAHQLRDGGDAEGVIDSDRKAVGAFDKVLALSPGHAQAISGKAASLASLGEIQAAVTGFREAIKRCSPQQMVSGLCAPAWE